MLFNMKKGMKSAHDEKIHLYLYAVINHEAAADEREKCHAIVCDWDSKIVC